MKSKLGDLHYNFFMAKKIASPKLSSTEVQVIVNEEWKSAKAEYQNKDDFVNFINKKILMYKHSSTKNKASMMSYIIKQVFKLFLLYSFYFNYFYYSKILL